jgi:DNA (cytosine-5)-methyltransferase 1
MGYHRAGFDVVGVDIEPQPHYPFEFIQGDALAFVRCGSWYWQSGYFDAIHASPPCQRFSDLAKRNGNADDWPDLIDPVRERLKATGLPYVIENVEGAPLIDPITLCGVSFPELRVIRHRLFESNVPLEVPPHKAHPLVFTHDKRKAHYGQLDQDTAFVQVTGGGNCTVANKRAATGIDWMTGAELNEAVPPVYTEYIGRQLSRARGICEFTHPSCQPGFRHRRFPECIGWRPATEDGPTAAEKASDYDTLMTERFFDGEWDHMTVQEFRESEWAARLIAEVNQRELNISEELRRTYD